MSFFICCDVIRQMLHRGLQHKFAMSWLQTATDSFYSNCCTFTIVPSIAPICICYVPWKVWKSPYIKH